MFKGIFADKNTLTGKTTYYRSVFLVAMAASVVVMFVTLLVTRGESARSFLFVGGSVKYNSDTFMDFFNSIVNTYNNPYDAKVIYPAICSLFFRFMLLLIRPSDFAEIVTDPNKAGQNPELKLYAYRKYELPENLPEIYAKLYMAVWRPTHNSSGWIVVNRFYADESSDEKE